MDIFTDGWDLRWSYQIKHICMASLYGLGFPAIWWLGSQDMCPEGERGRSHSSHRVPYNFKGRENRPYLLIRKWQSFKTAYRIRNMATVIFGKCNLPQVAIRDLRHYCRIWEGFLSCGRNDGERRVLHSRCWLRESLAIGRTERRPVQLQHSEWRLVIKNTQWHKSPQ